MSGLNPKVFLLILAILPQFVTATAEWPLPAQILLLGIIHLVSCAVVYLVVGFGADAILRSRPAAARAVSRVAGVVMTALGAFLLVEQLVIR